MVQVWKLIHFESYQMSPVNAHAFSIPQTSHQVPIDFLVAKAGPTVQLRFTPKVVVGPPFGGFEKQISSVTVVELHCFASFLRLGEVFRECLIPLKEACIEEKVTSVNSSEFPTPLKIEQNNIVFLYAPDCSANRRL
jgi:hypothetical protein